MESVTLPPPANVMPPVPFKSSPIVTAYPSVSIVPPPASTVTVSLACAGMNDMLSAEALNVPLSNLNVASAEALLFTYFTCLAASVPPCVMLTAQSSPSPHPAA